MRNLDKKTRRINYAVLTVQARWCCFAGLLTFRHIWLGGAAIEPLRQRSRAWQTIKCKCGCPPQRANSLYPGLLRLQFPLKTILS